MTIDVARALEAGIRRLETHGWTDGPLKNYDRFTLSPTCASNAIALALNDPDRAVLVQMKFAEYLSGTHSVAAIFAWNDAPVRPRKTS